MLALHRVPLLERPGAVGRVVALVVDERRRREGVASRLLAAAVDSARELGCTRLEVMTRRDRADAHAFYERHGFADVCERSARFERPL